MRSRRIAVVGASAGGATAALLLSRDGHRVDLFDRPVAERPAGAGIVLQQLGQQVLGRLDLLAPLQAVSAPVRRVEALTRQGRAVMDFAYADIVPGAHGLGVHRGRLIALLDEATRDAELTKVDELVTGKMSAPGGGWLLSTRESETEYGPYDLVIGADGSHSLMRRQHGLTRRNRPYPWGAVWALVPDPDGLAGDVLNQRYDGTRVTLGLVPVGRDEAMVFWSARLEEIDDLIADDDRWHALAHPHAGRLAPLVDRAAALPRMAARYFDVRVHRPCAPGLALVGDAAHATSPQLGTGASLALADAWTIAAALRRYGDRDANLDAALDAYAGSRRQHVAYYQWVSKVMTPAFQSGLTPLAWLRDGAMPTAARVPWVRRQMVTTLMGVRTSPWGMWSLPD